MIKPAAVRIVAVYIVVGALWIKFSDSLLVSAVKDPFVLTRIEMVKGWFYVLVTGIMLYFLILRSMKKLESYETSLRASNEQFRRAVIDAPYPIMIHAEDGEVIAINNIWSEITGYAQLDIPTVDVWTELAYGDRKQEIRKTIRENFFITEPRDEGEFVISTRSGELRTWRFSSSTLGTLEDGRRTVISIAVDVTEHKRLEDNLIHAQRMESVGRLAGGIAHDFNNIITAILGYTELATSEVAEDGPGQLYLKNVKQSALRAADLTNQLLAFARKQIVEPRLVNVNEMLTNLEQLLRRLLGEDIQLRFELAQQPVFVLVDPVQLEQIIINLAVNARDAMPTGGLLAIEAVPVIQEASPLEDDMVAGEYVLLAISDTGEGMTEEIQKRLFEPFFTTKPQGKGTGLGLATCYGIVKQNKGKISFYSEPGTGTTFKVYLPRVYSADSKSTGENNSVALEGNETLLLVEDEPIVRAIAAHALRSFGYTVLEACDGAEGLATFESSRTTIDLVVTDIVMPKMGGKKLADRLRKIEPNAKILFISGYTDNAFVSQGLHEPTTSYIQKPFTPASLARKVREVLDASVPNNLQRE